MKIAVGTKNQNKVETVKLVFSQTLAISDIDVIPYDAPSGMPEAPHDRETYLGALNRAKACREYVDADYYVGIESGLVLRYDNFFEEAWAVIISRGGQTLVGYSSGLLLPKVVTDRMESGEKHNEIMEYFDKYFDLPEDNRDTWSRYTGGEISRRVSIEEALRNALVQVTSSEQSLYKL